MDPVIKTIGTAISKEIMVSYMQGYKLEDWKDSMLAVIEAYIMDSVLDDRKIVLQLLIENGCWKRIREDASGCIINFDHIDTFTVAQIYYFIFSRRNGAD